MAMSNVKHCVEERSKFFEGLEETDIEGGTLHAYIASLSYQKGDYKSGMEHYGKVLETRMMLCGGK